MNTEELEVERVVDAARKWGGELNRDLLSEVRAHGLCTVVTIGLANLGAKCGDPELVFVFALVGALGVECVVYFVRRRKRVRRARVIRWEHGNGPRVYRF